MNGFDPQRTPTARPNGRAAADAIALSQLLRDSLSAGAERQALHLRLSSLAPRLQQGYHQRLLREALEPALRPTRGRLYELPNGDLVAVAPARGMHLRQVERALAVLFDRQAAAAGAGGDQSGGSQSGGRQVAAPLPDAYTLLDLPRDAVALMAALEDAFGGPAPVHAPPLGPPPGPVPGQPAAPGAGGAAGFGPADLAILERALRGASLARFLRRRPVCRLAPGGEPQRCWEEWRIAMPELLGTLLPGGAPVAAPWLLRRLQRALECRLLAELARPQEARQRGPIGLQLSAATLGTPEFLQLDALLDAGQRARTVLALPAADALAQPDDVGFAREFCRARGYRVALDVPAPGLLPLLVLDGYDLVRLAWSGALAAAAPSLPLGPERVVLTGADRAAAIGWGWEAGITLFEGTMLRPQG